MENYSIPFKEALEMPEYKRVISIELAEIPYLIKEGKVLGIINPFIIEFGNTRIDLTVEYMVGCKKPIIEYYIYYRKEGLDTRWLPFDWSDTKIEIEDTKQDNIEENMYYELMNFAKKNNLTWSKLNK